MKKSHSTNHWRRSLKKHPKLFRLLGAMIFGVLITSVVVSYGFFYLRSQLKLYRPINFEVSFISPHQAVVFFKSQTPQVFYLKTGDRRSSLDKVYTEASKKPTTMHVIEIGSVPTNGLWIKFQVQGASWLVNYFMPYEFLTYQTNQVGEMP